MIQITNSTERTQTHVHACWEMGGRGGFFFCLLLLVGRSVAVSFFFGGVGPVGWGVLGRGTYKGTYAVIASS